MRTALLSAVKRTSDGELRAHQPFGGRSVLSWQIGLMRELGCKRILCLCEALGDELLQLQSEIEAEGMEFHAIRSILQLVGLVRADDELVMLMDGLMLELPILERLGLSDGRFASSIAILPSGHRLPDSHPDDFERIDRERHWAGIASFRATKLHKLSDMPEDGDAISMLLRLTLQDRVPCADILRSDRDAQSLFLVEDSAEIIAKEKRLIADTLSSLSENYPSHMASSRIVRWFAPKGLAYAAPISFAISSIAIAGAIGLAILSQPVAALATAALGVFLADLGTSWSKFRQGLWGEKPTFGNSWVLYAGRELVCVLLLILALGSAKGTALQFALPVLALMAAHLAGRSDKTIRTVIWRDQPVQLTGFAIAAAAGLLGEALMIFAMAALIDLRLRPSR